MTVYIKCSGMHRTQNKNAPSGERFDVFDVAMHSKHINCVHRNGVCRKGHTLDLGRPVLPCSSCVFAHKHTHARTHTDERQYTVGPFPMMLDRKSVVNRVIHPFHRCLRKKVFSAEERHASEDSLLLYSTCWERRAHARTSFATRWVMRPTDNVRQPSVCVQLGKCPFPRNSYQMECDFDDNFLQ